MDVSRITELPQLGTHHALERRDSGGIADGERRTEATDALSIATALVALERVGRTLPIELVGAPTGRFFA